MSSIFVLVVKCNIEHYFNIEYWKKNHNKEKSGHIFILIEKWNKRFNSHMLCHLNKISDSFKAQNTEGTAIKHSTSKSCWGLKLEVAQG